MVTKYKMPHWIPGSIRKYPPFFAIFLLSTLLLSGITACEKDPDPIIIRIMSYNIAAGYGDISAVADVIREYEPDIVALQEVDIHWSARSGYEDQIAWLADALDMHYFPGEIYTLQPDREGGGIPDRRFGLAFLSKQPISYSRNNYITRHSTQPDAPGIQPMPGFPHIAVYFDDVIIHFYNTHLDYRSDPAVREVQVMEMIEFVDLFYSPSVLAGDLNARPDASELAPLFDFLQDAWEGQDEPGYTFPADAPDRRIDYILHTHHFEVLDIRVLEDVASDHLPVLADLHLIKRR